MKMISVVTTYQKNDLLLQTVNVDVSLYNDGRKYELRFHPMYMYGLILCYNSNLDLNRLF